MTTWAIVKKHPTTTLGDAPIIGPVVDNDLIGEDSNNEEVFNEQPASENLSDNTLDPSEPEDLEELNESVSNVPAIPLIPAPSDVPIADNDVPIEDGDCC